MNPQGLLASESFGVCLRDEKGAVVFQNARCVAQCKAKTGTICEGPCTQKYAEASQIKRKSVAGFFLFQKLKLARGPADVMVVKDGAQFLTLLYPLENQNSEKMEHYRERKLSSSELRIASLLLQGCSNLEIASSLFISKVTLKTHINNINKKVSPEMRPRS